MPSDFLTEHRQQFSNYQTQLQRENYLFFSGQKMRREIRYLEAEFSDLYSHAAIERLAQELADAKRETDQAALRLLIANAAQAQSKAKVRDLSDEIAVYESHATIVWEGETISFSEATALLQAEPNPTRRHHIAARRDEVIKGIQDLRAERLEKLHATSGAETYLERHQKLCGIVYEQLASQLTSLLDQTESQYVSALSPLLLREANVSLDEATQADLPYFQKLGRFQKFFPAWQIKHALRETFSGLGILIYKQNNLAIDDQSRPRKSTRGFHFPICVPDEIKVLVTAQDGVRSFTTFLHEMGHAQQFAWTSRNLYPEFQSSGDGAVREVFGLLFAGLLNDPRWLSEMVSYQENAELRHLLAVQRLLSLRRHTAKLIYETELHANQLNHTAGSRYAELLTDAVRVRYDETHHLRDVDDGFAAADYLRAAAFEAQLREQLKTKFGSRWWDSRKAGDYLIDLWNTGGRYQAEELAKMIDLGELSFDWLVEECLANLHA